MNKKIIKQIIVILALIVTLFAIYKLIKTYAVFYSEADATIEQKQANWIIKVNNTNISSGIEQQFTVNEIEVATNSRVTEGKIAPGGSGSFYITIDPSNTDVAIRYDIQLDKSNLTNDKIKIASIQEILNSNSLIQSAQDTYTGVISLSDIKAGKTNKIKTDIMWENDETQNDKDTEVGTKKNPTIDIPIKINVIQYLGETITPYVQN